MESVLEKIHSLLGNKKSLAFLDAGSGSGFLAYRAYDRFKDMTVVDISQKMLDRIDLPGTKKICSDACAIPVEDGSYDVVGAFATLHHLQSPDKFFKEAYRILRPGGVLYSDHDIESKFVGKFRPILKLYRALFDHGKGYLKLSHEATKEDYLLSEYHGDNGLSGPKLEAQLCGVGFNVVEVLYHWEGMGPVASILEKIGLTSNKHGFGPVVRILAIKP
jgi:ubiquinone/menaquinone biosynthesis C-methylase UbiE